MQRTDIPANKFNVNIFEIWERNWFLLTSGTKEKYNMMTIAWGSIGRMWNKHFAQVVVRPSRYTYNFMNEFDTFTMCAFSDEYHRDLSFLGAKTGKDGDKLAGTSLTVMPAQTVEAPVYKEAELIFECRTIYQQEMDENKFIADYIEKCYPGNKDYHKIFFGEILHIEGTEKYIKK